MKLKLFMKHKKTIFITTLLLFLFIKISEDVVEKELSIFDNTIYAFVGSFITEDMTGFMKFLSFIGSGTIMSLITAIVIIAMYKKKYATYGWMTGVNLLASTVLNYVFKIIYQRERPNILRLIDITGFSFPSGHSMVSLCFYGFIAYILWTKVKSKWRFPLVFLLIALIVSIGISRIYLGVHYASDVLGGFSAGLAWLAVFIQLSKYVHKKYDEDD